MSGEAVAPVLAALLRRALPDTTMLDLGQPFGRLFPWWPGALCGVADTAGLPAAERDLLRGFRQGGPLERQPLLGLDPAADAAWPLGADSLVCEAAGESGCHHLSATLTLRPAVPSPTAAANATAERGRILLLIGTTARIEPWELLLPAMRTETLFAALRAAAETLAAADDAWQAGGRLVSPGFATMALRRHGNAPSPPLRLNPATLPNDLPVLTPRTGSPNGLDTGSAPRVRLLLGLLPPMPMRLRLGFSGGLPLGLFLDGLRQRVESRTGPFGTPEWEVPIQPAVGHSTVLGLALPKGGLTLQALDLLT